MSNFKQANNSYKVTDDLFQSMNSLLNFLWWPFHSDLILTFSELNVNLRRKKKQSLTLVYYPFKVSEVNLRIW